MKRSIKSKDYHSRAGKIGSSSRWKNHIKEETKLVRVYTNDYDFIASYCDNFGISFIMAFRYLCRFVRRNHGYSAYIWEHSSKSSV